MSTPPSKSPRPPFEELGADRNGMRMWSQHQAAPPYRYTTPWPGRAHALLLWDAAFEAPDSPDEDMGRLSDEIVEARCAWCHSAGFNGSDWDDLVDMVHVMAGVMSESEGIPNPLPIKATMTTWTSPQPDEDQMVEAAEFFCSDVHTFGDSDEWEPFDSKLVVCLGGDAQTYARLRSLVCSLITDGRG